jgi:hypothetical protein
MTDYTSNFAALLTGHLGLPGDPPAGGQKHAVGSDKYIPQGRTPIDTNLDIRDALSHAIAGGYTSLSDEDIKANFSHISGLVGSEKANKLFLQAFLFNQRSDVSNKKGEDRVQQFYDIGSSDPETKKTLLAIQNLGSGVREGYRNSVNEGVRLMSGTDKRDVSKYGDATVSAVQSTINKKTDQ